MRHTPSSYYHRKKRSSYLGVSSTTFLYPEMDSEPRRKHACTDAALSSSDYRMESTLAHAVVGRNHLVQTLEWTNLGSAEGFFSGSILSIHIMMPIDAVVKAFDEANNFIAASVESKGN